MQETPNYYAIIPAEVRYDKKLRPNEKLLYGEIVALSNKTGICNASNNYFAKLFEVYPSAISKWIKDLEENGYILVEYIREQNKKEIKERHIKINVFTNMNRVFTKIEEGYSQKQKENNTSINNIYTTNISGEKNIYEIVEGNFGRTISPIERETISTWEAYNFPLDLLKYAVSKAILKNIYNIKYIDKILYQWDKDNIRTLGQAKKSDEDFEKKKQNKSLKPKNNENKYQSFQERERERLRQLEEEAKRFDEMEALKNAKTWSYKFYEKN